MFNHGKYGFIVGKISLNGDDVNLKLVQADLAWYYKNIKKYFMKDTDRFPNPKNYNPDKKHIKSLIHRISFLHEINKKKL